MAMEMPPPEVLAEMAKDDLSGLTKNIVIAFTVISAVFVSLRICTRLRYQAIGWEDYSIVAALAFAIVCSVFQVLQADAGNGRHALLVPFPEGVELILKYLFWSILGYNISLTFTKASIILQYRRIFTLREMRLPLHIALGIIVAFGLTTFFVSVFTCVPVQAFWKPLEQASAKCLPDTHLWYSVAGLNIATDLLVALLPVKVIWSLQIAKKQKIALLGILTIGWFVCVVSFLRLHALVLLAQHPNDRTYYSAATAYWSSIEMNLAIVCASLPALKPLIAKIIPGFSSTRGGSRGYAYGSNHRSGTLGKHYGLGSTKGTRSTSEGDVELGQKSVNMNAYSTKKGDQSTFGNSIHVTQRFEQHFEENGHSDSDSQKDLVANTSFPTPYAKC